MIQFLFLVFVIICSFILNIANCATCGSDNDERPNIMFILLDDLGWGDLSVKGGQFATPNMDILYENSLKLDRHYVHLMCSPSRTQFLTGRYAMNLGFGEFIPWDNSEIGGIPIGQPTIANWLSQFGDYSTYAVGKWHAGYATKQLTPLPNGFDHFYGFYQGAIDYNSKTYNDIVDGDVGLFDFFEDGEASYDAVSTDTNTMYLYQNKIKEYLDIESNKKLNGINTPFYMYAALQSMHVPFPDVPEFEEECGSIVDSVSTDTSNRYYKSFRKKYCALLKLTDIVIGNIIDTLKTNNLYDNTLIVFTTDNGGEISRGASNYPFRGTKGEMFDGNSRVITLLSGGIIEKAKDDRGQNLIGNRRDDIISNLDWTPTLLEFAGYLDCINKNHYTWDGINQYDMIMGKTKSPNYVKRDNLVLNIGDEDLDSASIVFEYEGTIYKYIKSSQGSIADRWIYSDSLIDAWSIIQDEEFKTIQVLYYSEDNEDLKFSQYYEDQYLFDVTNDASELYNLLNPDLGHYNQELNEKIIIKAREMLTEHKNNNKFWSTPISALHARLEEEKFARPKLIGDGKFVRPFLTKTTYIQLITRMFEGEESRGHYHSQQQKDLYFNQWHCPKPMDKSLMMNGDDNDNNINNHKRANSFLYNFNFNMPIIVLVSVLLIPIIILTVIIYQKRASKYQDYRLIK